MVATIKQNLQQPYAKGSASKTYDSADFQSTPSHFGHTHLDRKRSTFWVFLSVYSAKMPNLFPNKMGDCYVINWTNV